MDVTEVQQLTFLQGGGEMGALIRSKDWSKTSIGTPDTWPQSLRITTSIILNSQFPMFVWWGNDQVTIYNDAYRVIAGDKHPALLGTSGPVAWAETWDQLAPLSDMVMKGTSTWSEDQLLYINRRGYTEESYFTFSYSPVINDDGAVGGLFCVCIETTEKVLAARQINESEKNLRNTILQSPVAMCILRGPSFVVEIANDRMYELWGKTQEQMVHKPLFEGLPEVKQQGFEELLKGVYATGVPFSANERATVLPRGGQMETVFINFIYTPFRDGDGTISGVIAVAIDVTTQVLARKRIEESEQYLQQKVKERTAELEAINHELKRTNENLEEFAYAASHDLKEPIRKIHFFSDRLRDKLKDRMEEGETQLFERMEKASKRMGSLIDDLLAYSQLTKGLSSLEEINLNAKVDNVLEDLELEISEKQANIRVGKLPTILGQKRQMQQLFQNLVANALKYSKPGIQPEISITAKVIRGKEAGVELPVAESGKEFHLIEVKDNGIGFEQSDAQRIFNVFTRLHGNSEFRGSGVGLSIVRKVVENHQGFIWAESSPGSGATFHILIPVQQNLSLT